MHSTNNLNDEYFGSGVGLMRAIKKYGKHNFKREILYVFDNYEDMVAKEIELVNENVVNDSMSYNMKLGGEGGSAKGRFFTKKHKQNLSKATKGRKFTEEHKLKLRKAFQGENSSSAKLTEKQAIQIKYDPRLWIHGGVKKIAEEYGRHTTTILDIKHRRKWIHI